MNPKVAFRQFPKTPSPMLRMTGQQDQNVYKHFNRATITQQQTVLNVNQKSIDNNYYEDTSSEDSFDSQPLFAV